MKLIRAIAGFTGLGIALALLMAYVSPFVDPRKIWIPAVFGLAYPYLFLLGLVWTALLFFIRSLWAWLLLIVLASGFNYTREVYHPFGPAQGNAAQSIQIVSFNTKVLGRYENRDISAELFQFLNKESPDIVCLQEVLISPGELREYIKTGPFKHYWLSSYIEKPGKKQKFGKVILTGHPVKDKGILEVPGSTIRFGSFADIEIDKKIVRVYNVHLQKTLVTDQDYQFIQNEADGDERTIRFSRALLSKLIKAYKLRASQADELRAHIQTCPYPVVVCGDLNDTRLSYAYRTITGAGKGLEDAFLESGRGIAQTYRGPVPFLRLDFVLASPELRFRAYKTYKNIASDHKLLQTHLH